MIALSNAHCRPSVPLHGTPKGPKTSLVNLGLGFVAQGVTFGVYEVGFRVAPNPIPL